MKKITLLLLLICSVLITRSQTKTGDDVLTIAEQMPAFPGGEKAMKEYISKTTVYPKVEKEFRVGGLVYLTFIVNKDGTISDIKVLKGIKAGPALNKEAIRVLSSMPKWKPGMQNGKAVSVQMAVPVKFILDNNEPLKDEEMIALANKHYKAGFALAAKKDFKGALEEFNYTIFCLPSDINTLYQRGLMFHNLNRDKEACDEWNKVKFQDSNVADDMLSKFCK